jgi:hypothetical protein
VLYYRDVKGRKRHEKPVLLCRNTGYSPFKTGKKQSTPQPWKIRNREKRHNAIKKIFIIPGENEKRKPLSYDFLIYIYCIQQNKVDMYYLIMSSTNI